MSDEQWTGAAAAYALCAALITTLILVAAGWLMWLAPTTGGGPGL